MPGEANGTVEIKFKEQKKFEYFGRNFGTCAANFGVRASFSKPVPRGDLTYDFNFQAGVSCDQFLQFFNVAYEKSINNKSLSAHATKPLVFAPTADFVAGSTAGTVLVAPDYTASLKTCGLPRLSADVGDLVFKATVDPTPPASLVATAVDSQLNYAATAVPMEMVNANAYLTLFAQAAARAVLKSQGVDITNTDYLTTKGWFDQVVTQLMDLGFVAKLATTGGLQENTYSGQINLGEIINTLLSAYLGAAELTEFQALANMLNSDPDNTQTTGFLDFWWSAASSDTKRTNIAFGPVVVDQGQASVMAVFFSIDVAFQDWRSLFVSFHHEGVNIISSAIQLDLNMDVWAQRKADVTTAVQAAIAKHVRTTTLNFG
jgi:hypothetical protein